MEKLSSERKLFVNEVVLGASSVLIVTISDIRSIPPKLARKLRFYSVVP